jgi:hypothetical protein
MKVTRAGRESLAMVVLANRYPLTIRWQFDILQFGPGWRGPNAIRPIEATGIITFLGAAVAWPLAARAEQPARLPRIGILWPNPVTASGHFVDAFRQGLGELGYVEGRNMTIEFRTAEGTMERLPDLAAELPASSIVSRFGKNIRLSSYLANSASKSQN